MTSSTMEDIWKLLEEYNIETDSTDSEFICIICKKILIQPRAVHCGCRYCYDCLVQYLNGGKKYCLGKSEYCQSELINIDLNVFIDQLISIKIARLIVKCPLKSCDFKTKLIKMGNHIITCDKQSVKCPYYNIGCQMDKIEFDKVKQHLDQESYSHVKLIIELLDNWRNEMKIWEMTLLEFQQEHVSLKKEMKHIKIESDQLFTEKRSFKELELVKLDIKTEQLKSEEILIQLNQKIEKDEKLLLQVETNQEQTNLRIETIVMENKSLREELKLMKSDIGTLHETILLLQKKTEEKKQEMKKSQAKIENLELRLNGKCDQTQRNQKQMKTRIDEMSPEYSCVTTEAQNVEDPMKTVQIQSNKDEFVWYIKNWSDKMKLARNGTGTSIFSDPFYSHKNGYKMCLNLYPVSYGSCKGTHLSLGICIMLGEFDNNLQWPFRHGIKLDLMNQESGLAHVSQIVRYENYPTSDAWKKPTSERNFGYFYHAFVTLFELSTNVALCRGDQILIRATPQIN